MDIESHAPAKATNVRPAEREKVYVVTYHEVPPPGEMENDPQIFCAAMGLIFSWIPIVGILTFCLNLDAPPGSPRHSLASAALSISLFVLVFNLLFWSIWLS